MDTSVFYRLTNGFLGPGRSLDVRSDGSGQLSMGTSNDSSGQKWRLAARDGGKYAADDDGAAEVRLLLQHQDRIPAGMTCTRLR